MDAKRWSRVKELLDRSLALQPDERRAFLDRECTGPDDMRQAVDSLLDAHDQAQTFLERPLRMARELPLPERIGPYHLKRRLGEGGMGQVHLAEQLEPVERTVALKLVRSEMASREVLRRFDMERQALALMEHRNIARVYDTGAVPDGRAYFVMEYVDGEPITQHCDEQTLDSRARLEILQQVCIAVQHAHEKGIIHRDIKPSNVLVKTENGRPVPVVIDFGIAKATAQTRTEGARRTEVGRALGTPEYMSPEQAAGSPDIDTRTDVYSLGVLMYELLTGALPGRTSETLTPSEQVRKSAEQVARNRRATRHSLVRQLRGELDWITMKALATDRGERYSGASELAQEIGHYLSGLPVVAGPPGFPYRFRKFVRRHSIATSLVGLLLVAVLAGLAGSVYGIVRAKQAEHEAREEAARAEAASLFLSETLATINPSRAGRSIATAMEDRLKQSRRWAGLTGEETREAAESLRAAWSGVDLTDVARDVLVREVLWPAHWRIEKEGSADPVLTARLHLTLAQTYRTLGHSTRGIPVAELALQQHEQALGPENPWTVRSREELALHFADVGRFAEAERLQREVLSAREVALGPEHPDTLRVVHNLASALQHLRKSHEAQALYDRALDARSRVLGPESPDTLDTRSALANLAHSRGEYNLAEALHRKILKDKKQHLGAYHPGMLDSMHSLADAVAASGDLRRAERLYLENFKEWRWGSEHPRMLAMQASLALIEHSLGKFEAARQRLSQVLNARLRIHGQGHPESIETLSQLAGLHYSEGQLDEAQRLWDLTLQVQRRVLGSDAPETAETIANLGRVLHGQGRYEAAERSFRQALELTERAHGGDAPQIALTSFYLAELLRAVGRHDEALAHYERGYRVGEGEDDGQRVVPELQMRYVELLRESGNDTRAAEIETARQGS